jgi:hypothetical protein
MNEDVGGLAGGLYRVFEAVGLGGFTLLLGQKRSGRDALQGQRIVVGGMVAGGAVVALISGIVAEALRSGPWLTTLAAAMLGGTFGILIGLLLGIIVLHYMRKVDNELECEALKRKYVAEFLGKGLTKENAESEASRAAHRDVYGGCFIATACYGPDAPEVTILRTWRDHRLKHHVHGRVIVAAYEELGPVCARIIARNPHMKALTTRLLGAWCAELRRCR